MRSLGGVEEGAALLRVGGADDLIVHDDSPRLTVGSDSAGRRFDSENERARGQSGTGENRSEEHTSELQSLMRISYAVFCLKKKNKNTATTYTNNQIKNTQSITHRNTP